MCSGGVALKFEKSVYVRSAQSTHPWSRRNVASASASVIAAYAAALSLSSISIAKTPGQVHCYNGICHRVKSVEEMAPLVGMETEALTSFYDTA